MCVWEGKLIFSNHFYRPFFSAAAAAAMLRFGQEVTHEARFGLQFDNRCSMLGTDGLLCFAF